MAAAVALHVTVVFVTIALPAVTVPTTRRNLGADWGLVVAALWRRVAYMLYM